MMETLRRILIGLGFLFLAADVLVPAAGQEPPPAGQDFYGDPLPPHAVSRLGTVRLRHAGVDSHHGQSVTCLAYAPDGRAVASGGGDGTVRLWDVGTGKELRRLRGHQGPISSVAFSPDGSLLASAGGDAMVASRMWSDGDKTVRLWDVATGELRTTLRGHTRGVTTVAFAPDGKVVASGSLDGTVLVRDVSSGETVSSLAGYEGGVSSLAYTPDGRSLVTSDGAHLLRIRTIVGGEVVLTVPLHGRKGKWPNADVSNAFLSKDGRTIVSVDGSMSDRTPRLWDAATGKERPVPWVRDSEFREFVYAAALSPDGRVLATRGGAGKLHLWDPATGRILHDLRGHEYDVLAMAFSPDGKLLASGDDDRTIRLWDVATGAEVNPANAHGAWISSVAFAPDGKSVATTAGDATIRLWDPASGRPLRKIELGGQQNWGRRLAYAPDGKRLAATGRDSSLHLWTVPTGEKFGAWSAVPPEINGSGEVEFFAFSPDGSTIAVSMFSTLRLVDPGTGKELGRLQDPPGAVSWMSFSPDGQVLCVTGFPAAGSRACVFRVYDLASRRLARSTTLDSPFWPAGALSPDGRLVAHSSKDGTITLREVVSGLKLAELKGHAKGTAALAFSPDGSLLASGGYDSFVRLWRTGDGAERARFEGHAEHIESLAFSPDGKRLASVSSDTTGLVWDVSDVRAAQAGGAAPGDLDASWGDLAEIVDGAKVYRAIAALAGAGNGAVRLLKESLLRPEGAPEEMRKLVRALDHDDAEERNKAAAELRRSASERFLRAALLDPLSVEARNRLEGIVKGFGGPCPESGRALREIRAVQVLEKIGTREAREALEEIAGNVPEDRLAREAKAALARRGR